MPQLREKQGTSRHGGWMVRRKTCCGPLAPTPSWLRIGPVGGKAHIGVVDCLFLKIYIGCSSLIDQIWPNPSWIWNDMGPIEMQFGMLDYLGELTRFRAVVDLYCTRTDRVIYLQQCTAVNGRCYSSSSCCYGLVCVDLNGQFNICWHFLFAIIILQVHAFHNNVIFCSPFHHMQKSRCLWKRFESQANTSTVRCLQADVGFAKT